MGDYPKPPLSTLERLHFTLVLFQTLSVLFYSVITAPFRGSSYPAKFVDHIRITTLRYFLESSTVRQVQWLGLSVNELYPIFAKEKGFEPHTITLEDGTKAHWLGNSKPEKVLIWIHGGGFNLPPDQFHFEFTYSFCTPSSSVLMLAYTLAPYAIYPTQIQQAVAAVSHLITKENFSIEKISIGGDSAGGNLALAVVSHMLHPHPKIPPLDLQGKSFRGLVLLCPWVIFNDNYPSSKFNALKDVVSQKCGSRWSGAYMAGAETDAYNQPLELTANDPWWQGLDRVIGDIAVVAGGDEVLLSSVSEMAARLQKAHPRVELFVGQGEAHDKPINTLLGGGGKQAAFIQAFVKNNFS